MPQIVEVPGIGDVEFPDGMSEQDIVAAIRRASAPNPTEGMTTPQKVAAGAGKALADIGRGIRQRSTEMADRFPFAVPEVMRLIAKTAPMTERDVEEARAIDAPLMATGAGKVGNFAGNVAALAPTMFMPGANTYTGAGLLGAGIGLIQPTAEGESVGMNAVLGGGAGLVGQGIGNAVGRAIRPVQAALPPEQAALAAEAGRRNIPLTVGQATGSRPMQIAESVMENLPLTAGRQLAVKQAQKTAFNRAVGETFGSPADALTPDVLGAARNRIGQEFTNLASRNTLQANQGLVQQLGGIQQQVNRYATPDVARIVNNNIDDILSKIEPGDIITGRAYRELDSQLGRIARNTASGDARNYLGQVRGALRDAMDQSISAADRGAWREARSQYANLMTVAPLAAKSEVGDVSGRTLLNAANQANKNAKFGSPSELAELGRIGRAFVADNIPNSGTAQRQLMQSLLTGGGGAGIGAAGAAVTGNDPLEGAMIGGGLTAAGLLGPRVLQGAMTSPAGQAYLTRGLLNLTPAELAAINAASRSLAIGYAGQ